MGAAVRVLVLSRIVVTLVRDGEEADEMRPERRFTLCEARRQHGGYETGSVCGVTGI